MSVRVKSSVKDIKDHFAELPDPRTPINCQHLLIDVIVISVCGVLAGADGPAAIAQWAKAKQDWLRQHLELPHGVPSHDTIGRILQRLNPLAFQQCFSAWLESFLDGSGVRLLNIDGKTLRRSHDRKHKLGPLHVVSVWASEEGLTLAQVATAEKSNEITAIPVLLELVDIQGAIVTIDAMGCQKAIAKKIVDLGGDYVLPVKGNQGRLEEAVEAFFDDHLEDDFARVQAKRLETVERRHGRIERRIYLQVPTPKTLAGREEWAGLKTLGLVLRRREIDGQETGEVQPYISSMKCDIKQFARAVRGHWKIENACHWSLDMTFREDESRARDRRLAENLAWLRRFTLGLLKQHPDTKKSLAMKRRLAGWSDDFLTEVLFGTTT